MTNGVVPTKGHAFQFTCQISGNIDQIVKITLADPVTKGETDKCNCFGAACIKYNDNGHSCDINGTTKTLFVDIQQAKTTDDGVWICLTNDNGTLSRKSLNITVYSK